jgi:hypothetical protein
MLRSLALSLLTVVTLMSSAGASLGADESYNGVYFTTPPGWTSGLQDGRFILAPADMTDETAVVVVLYGAEKLGGKALDAWFKARMNSDLNPQAKVLNAGEIKSTSVGELKMLTTARAVQDAGGGIRIQMYHGVSDGRQVALAMGVTASEKAVTKYSEGIQALFGSLRFSASVNRGANPSAGSASSSTPPQSQSNEPQPESRPSESGSKQVTASDLTGYWVHSSSSYADYVKSGTGADVRTLTRGYGKEYEFAADGTYKYYIDSAITIRSLIVTETDSGTWGFENSKLVLKSKERNNIMKFYIIDYQKAPNGTAFLTLLNDMFALTESSIHDYEDILVRVAARKTGSKK